MKINIAFKLDYIKQKYSLQNDISCMETSHLTNEFGKMLSRKNSKSYANLQCLPTNPYLVQITADKPVACL